MDTFASRLKYARTLRHLSQAALARKCGLSQSAIASYERGTRKEPSKILALASALEVNAHWLGEGQGPTFPVQPAGLSLGETTWPFRSINPQLFWSLPLSDREAAERALATFIDGLLKARTP
ncbi:MAG TPA: helix-turn-helix transcriptional regulator [Castellaniella sp.]|uniref:helix-turn-helix domain-containing protein n=1 Tax=Castellaniella sp. TaxID=1955812 RepID=UPI002F0C9E72